MTLWKTILTYDGTPYRGWQVQPGLPTVQGTLAQAIRKITGESVLPQGSGRTDTGVHALGQVASFEIQAPIPAANLHRALNRALPPSIRVLSVEPAPAGFHARHSALRKTYEYRIFNRVPHDRRCFIAPIVGLVSSTEAATVSQPPDLLCSPFLAPYVWDCRWPLDLALMQQAAVHILGTHDFTSFAATDPDRSEREADEPVHATNIRTVFESAWQRQDDLFVYRVTGSGFLHRMVRNLVGTFVEAGAGRIAPDSIPAILGAHSRPAAGITAPARGLFLVGVEY